jgi:hypothetical protein
MGELVQSIFEIGSAIGTSTQTLMGAVILQITDDEGEKNLFALNNVNYPPGSLVNLLSLHQLAKLYPDSSGYRDKNGTGIHSGFYCHPMFWDREKFKKTFQTTASGLPECLFNSGYSKLEIFSTTILKFYNDTINWAFTSKDKLNDIADFNKIMIPLLKTAPSYLSLRTKF